MREEIDIIKLLQSGDFTIIYWDRGTASLYQKKWKKEEEFDRDEYETLGKFLVREYTFEDGYCPQIVGALTKALGGTSDSI